MLATEDIFLEDFNDGTLEQYAILQKNLSFIIGSKIFVYWLVIGVPISIIGTIFALEQQVKLLLVIKFFQFY